MKVHQKRRIIGRQARMTKAYKLKITKYMIDQSATPKNNIFKKQNTLIVQNAIPIEHHKTVAINKKVAASKLGIGDNAHFIPIANAASIALIV